MMDQFKKAGIATLLASVAIMSVSCNPSEPPVLWSLVVPEPNELEFGAELTGRYGLGLDGEFDIDEWGRIFVEPETPDQGFRFGFGLNTGAFDHENWVGYEEVTTLPTGGQFPTWMTGRVVDIEIPPLNIGDEVEWHLYLGTRGKFYLGLAALLKFLGDVPDINIGYTFYDDNGNVIIGLSFFGPGVVDGERVNGGIFVGTDLTRLVPDGVFPVDPDRNVILSGTDLGMSSQPLSLESSAGVNAALAMDWVEKANRGEEIRMNGRTVTSNVNVSGREARRYRNNERRIRGVIDRYTRASRRR
jgi:hypothetical protein